MIHLTVQQLSASLDGALTGPSLELVVRHLAACHECRDRQARLAKHDDALRRLLAQEPSDVFLDDLTRRAEALATAIARGIPAPIMVTSVPLLHEEDPYAPAEPPPLPPRPELGRSGELAKEAGWGRIGVKPSAPAQVPHSDPEEARRLLDALGAGHHDDFTELTAQGHAEHPHVDGPVFDLPAWIKDQAGRSGPRSDGPRAVPKVDMFFERLDELASDVPREAVDEALRRDTPPARPPFEDGTAAPESEGYAQPEPGPARPEPVHYEPPGWHAQPAPAEYADDAGEQWGTPHTHEAPAAYESAAAAPQASGYATAGWHYQPGPPAESNDAAWGVGAIDPGALEPATYRQPIVGNFGEYQAEGSGALARGTRPADRLVVVALVTVGALILILLALQLAPAGPRHATQSAPPPAAVVSPPAPAPKPRPATKKSVPVPPKPRTRSAETLPPVDQIVPPLAMPDAAPGTDSHATQSSHGDAVASSPAHTSEPAAVPAAPKPSRTATHTATKPTAVAGGALAGTRTTNHATTTPVTTTPAATTPAPAPAPPPVPEPEAAAPSAATSDEVQWPLLCGQIEDDAGQPVSNARVSMAEISFATRTDARGRFCVSAPAGAHSLFIEASGFTPRREPVTLSGSSTDVHIRLQPAR